MSYKKEKITKELFNLRDGKITFKPGMIFYVRPEWLSQEKTSSNTKARPMMVIGYDAEYRMTSLESSTIKMCELTSNFGSADCIPMVVGGMVTYVLPYCTANVYITNLMSVNPYACATEAVVELAKYLYIKPVTGEVDEELETLLSEYQLMILTMLEDGTLQNYRRMSEIEFSDMRKWFCGGKFRDDAKPSYMRHPDFRNYILPGYEPKEPDPVLTNYVAAVDNAKNTRRDIGTVPMRDSETVYQETPEDGFNSLKNALGNLVSDIKFEDAVDKTKKEKEKKVSKNKEQVVKINKSTKKEPANKLDLKSYQRYGIGNHAGEIKLISKKDLTDEIRYDYLTDCVNAKGIWKKIALENNCSINTATSWAKEALESLESSKKELPEGVYTIFISKRGRRPNNTSVKSKQASCPA